MDYLLDTNVFMHIANRSQGAVRLADNMAAARRQGDRIAISAITLFELEKSMLTGVGKVKKENLERLERLYSPVPVKPFTKAAAEQAAEIGAALEKGGKKIGAYDTLIAGHAAALDFIMVTHNIKEFTRVQGLSVVDWTK